MARPRILITTIAAGCRHSEVDTMEIHNASGPGFRAVYVCQRQVAQPHVCKLLLDQPCEHYDEWRGHEAILKS